MLVKGATDGADVCHQQKKFEDPHACLIVSKTLLLWQPCVHTKQEERKPTKPQLYSDYCKTSNISTMQ